MAGSINRSPQQEKVPEKEVPETAPDTPLLDLSDAALAWTLIGPAGVPVLQSGDAGITVVDASAGAIRIAVHHSVTAQLAAGRYLDALQLTIGDVVSPLWLGQILVAANPRRVSRVRAVTSFHLASNGVAF